MARIDRLLDAVRSTLPRRPTAAELPTVLASGALIVDTRTAAQRHRDGELTGAVVVERNHLEWRLDPTSPHRMPGADDPDRLIVVVCDEGYASTLAAASLQQLGLRHATDLDGGFQPVVAHRAMTGSETSTPPR
ncbi:MAG: rhodanese-like domain-containing protein [Acidimicrobiales bacterium]